MYGCEARANRVSVDRRVAPAQYRQPLFAGNLFKDAFADQPVVRIHGKKNHADAVLTGPGHGETHAGRFPFKKCVRNLNQNARAIACLRIASASATVGQINQDLHALHDNVMRLASFNAGDKSDTACIMLVQRVIQSLSRRYASKWV